MTIYNHVPAGDTPERDHVTSSAAMEAAMALLPPPAIPIDFAELKETEPIGGITVPNETRGATSGSNNMTPAPATKAKFIKLIKSGVPAGGLMVPPSVKSTLRIGFITAANASDVKVSTGGALTVVNQLARALAQASAIESAPPVGGLSIIPCMSDINCVVLAKGIILPL